MMATATDAWRVNPRLTGDDTGFRFNGRWVDSRILSGIPLYGEYTEDAQAYEQSLAKEAGLTVDPRRSEAGQFGGERVNSHGTYERYVHGPPPTGGKGGCRCTLCTAANREYMRAYRASKKAQKERDGDV